MSARLQSKVRKPAVAGLFYPEDSSALRDEVRRYIAEATCSGPVPKAVIAPHAGYIYSGPIAGAAYARVTPARQGLRRVVVIGPSHRVGFDGLALPSSAAFETPLGMVEVDEALRDIALHHRHVRVYDAAHGQEHGIEVHLPFLQVVLEDFTVLPIVCGDAKPELVRDVLLDVWGGPETLIVISSDLSHYLDYESACRLDRATSVAIEQMHPQDIGPDQACGRLAIQGLLMAAKQHGLHASTLDLRNSGDTAGSRDQVVGYGAYAFH